MSAPEPDKRTVANNDNRPASFDDMLVAHLGALHRVVRRQTANWREEIASDAIADILRNWSTFDPDKASFYTWMSWRVRGAVSNYRQKNGRVWGVEILADKIDAGSHAPEQEDIAELNAVLGHLAGMRNGDVLLRRAMGDTLDTIANDRGVSRSRIGQIEAEVRSELKRAA